MRRKEGRGGRGVYIPIRAGRQVGEILLAATRVGGFLIKPSLGSTVIEIQSPSTSLPFCYLACARSQLTSRTAFRIFTDFHLLIPSLDPLREPFRTPLTLILNIAFKYPPDPFLSP